MGKQAWEEEEVEEMEVPTMWDTCTPRLHGRRLRAAVSPATRAARLMMRVAAGKQRGD
jgi:hypothetical protein